MHIFALPQCVILIWEQVRPGRSVNEVKEYVDQLLRKSIYLISTCANKDVYRITRTTGNIVLAAGGVVRGITNWGTFTLPNPARKRGATYREGHYFIVRFDSGAKTQHAVRRTLGLDPRMIRYSIVKMGSTLEEIKDIAGKADWNTPSSTR